MITNKKQKYKAMSNQLEKPQWQRLNIEHLPDAANAPIFVKYAKLKT
jgi:hypothetical protein